jgi:hypothetical protein
MFGCLELLEGHTGYAPVATKQSPFLPYRDDPRFHALLRKWNLEDAPFASE